MEAVKLGKGGVVSYTAVRAGMAGVYGATGLPTDAGAKGLVTALGEGGLDNVANNPQGAAEAIDLARPVNRIDALLNYPSTPQEP